MVVKPKLHHVTIKTSQLQEMVDWSSAEVGLTVKFQDAHHARMSNDAANHRVAFLSVPGLGEDPRQTSRTGMHHTGMHHSAFEYDSFADLIASYRRVKELGMVPAFSLDHGVAISIYDQDPDLI